MKQLYSFVARYVTTHTFTYSGSSNFQTIFTFCTLCARISPKFGKLANTALTKQGMKN